ncbi:MAG: alanine racemase [Acidobacteriota bacterium]
MTAHRPTITKIDLDNLAFNYHSSRRFIGYDIKQMAVVKANAYGHGAAECSRRLESEGIDWLGVALPEEGFELREAGIRTPILCLGSFWSGQEGLLIEHAITPVVYQLDHARILNGAASEKQIVFDVHVKIDTGMGRIGVRFDEVEEFSASLKNLRNLRVDGVMTHFATADDLEQNDFTDQQVSRFYEAVDVFRKDGFDPTFIDLANSPGAVVHPNSRGNLVRLGGILYGLGGDVLPAGVDKPELKPVLSLISAIAHLKKVPAGETLGYGRTFTTTRDSVIATIPIGYYDGYRRGLSNRSNVIINGALAPVVGRVSMDWTLVDVSEITDATIGNEVVLVGKQNDLEIRAEELASMLETISYEITCGISRRVERQYTSS